MLFNNEVNLRFNHCVKHSAVKATFKALYFVCLTDRLSWDVLLAILCVCAHWPVQGTLVWDAPGFLWERLTFHFWWIRLLLTHCVSSFGKLDFRKPNRSRTSWGEPVLLGGVLMLAEQTCVCGTSWVTEPSLVLEVQATQQTIRDWKIVTTTPSCCLTLETSSQSVSVPCYYGKAKQWTICKQSHACLLEADNCVSSLLSLLCLSSLHPGQGNCL